MSKDKFCPFMSVERNDGMVNKVDCRKSCALYTPIGCAMIPRRDHQLDQIEGKLIELCSLLTKIDSKFSSIKIDSISSHR